MGSDEVLNNIGAGAYQVKIDRHVQLLLLHLAAVEKKLETAEGIEKTSLELMKKRTEQILAEEDIRTIWCADRSESLTGAVETIEIDGEPKHILIAPSYPGYHEIAAGPGKLVPVMSQSVAQACFNFAVMPGWQRHKPTYRIGVITAIDYESDTCSVSLIDARSHWQRLDINEKYSFANVPIKYMSCDSKAFEIDDRVIVNFVDQDWNTPRVIGFESAPQPCAVGSAVIIISAVSGNEAFAYDVISRTRIVDVGTLPEVITSLQELGYASPAKLVPSQTNTRSVAVASSGVTTIEGLWNIPEFYWTRTTDTYTTHGDACGMIGPADTYATQWFENDSAQIINYDHEILVDPDSEETRGRYYLKWLCRMFGWKEAFSGGLLLNHHLFDPEVHEGWLRPVYNDEEMTCESEVNFFAQLYYQENCASDGFNKEPHEQQIQHVQASGIASNDMAIVCFEDVVIRNGTTFTRHLRIFAKEKQPEMSEIEERVLDLINFERNNRDFPAIAWNHVLRRAALRHSTDMATNQFYGHVGSDSSNFYDRIDDAGFFAHETVVLPGGGEYGVGENTGRSSEGLKNIENLPPNITPEIYYEVMAQEEYSSNGVAENMVAIWMASTEGHRELLLHEDMLDFAVSGEPGLDGFTYWTYLAGFRHNFWKGYACVPTDDIMSYIDQNFSFTGDGDTMKEIEIYLS